MEGIRRGIELDLVTHDAQKFFTLLLKRNGYVLEQLYSPLIVMTNQAHEELKAIAHGCVTRFHSHHYLGFAETQWKLFLKESPPRVKPLLYVYRVLLTGLHLMRTGVVEANLVTLNDGEFRLPYIGELVDRKMSRAEQTTLDTPEIEFHRREYLGWWRSWSWLVRSRSCRRLRRRGKGCMICWSGFGLERYSSNNPMSRGLSSRIKTSYRSQCGYRSRTRANLRA